MKRNQALIHMRVAGYHDDKRTWTRLYIENRVALKKAMRAFGEGEKMREAGVLCTCHECQEG